jgi:hypothetical protein
MLLRAHSKKLHFPVLIPISTIAVPVFLPTLVPVVVVNIPMGVAGSLHSEGWS